MSDKKKIEDLLANLAKRFEVSVEKALSLAAIQYFVFEREDTDKLEKRFLTDGKNDGGVDAIVDLSDVSDQEGEGFFIIQSKHGSGVNPGSIKSEWRKIIATIESVEREQTRNIKDEVSSNIRSAIEADEKFEIIFMVSSLEKDKRNIHKAIKELNKDPRGAQAGVGKTRVFFGDDLLEKKQEVSSPQRHVESGRLKLWQAGDTSQLSILGYKTDQLEGMVVNVSAQGLKGLAEAYSKKGLFGGNVRYYTKETNVDDAIDGTIKTEPDQFWYLNNGVTIVAEGASIDGNQLELRKFSIINGGQTTALLKDYEGFPEKDFPMIAKIIVCKGDDDYNEDTKLKIAIASNTQKRIQPQDQYANASEQKKLRLSLQEHNPPVLYKIKRGEEPDDKTRAILGNKPKAWQKVDMRTLAQLLCSMKLARPDTAKARANDIFLDQHKTSFYDPIFNSEVGVPFIVDTLKLYSYRKSWAKKWIVNNPLPLNPLPLNKGHQIRASYHENLSKSHFHDLAMVYLAIREARGDSKVEEPTEGSRGRAEGARWLFQRGFMRDNLDEKRLEEGLSRLFFAFLRDSRSVIDGTKRTKRFKSLEEWDEMIEACLTGIRSDADLERLIKELFITE